MSGNSRSAADAALKSLTRALVDRVGGLDAAAAVLNSGPTRGVRRSQLANYYNPHCDQFLPTDLAARLEDVAGEPLVTAELARRLGYVLVRPQGAPAESLMQALVDVQAEAGDLARAMAEGMRDGHLCDQDLVRLEREATHVLREISELLATLQAHRARPSQILVVEDPQPRRWASFGTAMRDGLRRMRRRA